MKRAINIGFITNIIRIQVLVVAIDAKTRRLKIIKKASGETL